MTLLEPGSNVWRVEKADRASYLIDAEEYYYAFCKAVEKAEHSLMIIGWDLDSRVRLLRNGRDSDNYGTLAELLDYIISKKPKLEIRILIWDYSLIKVSERELWLGYKLGWKTHPRIRFSWDSVHPLGSSHHQKIVVIDDKLAFCGGIDLSKWRWDTSGHLAGDKRRTDPVGNSYDPYHDVQMMAEGSIAAALGDLARERWYRVKKEELDLPPDDAASPWPDETAPHFKNIDIGIARTEPEYKEYPEVREVERLYLDAIKKARRTIYVENQYTTSHKIGDAIAKRLAEEEGPEVIVVTHKESEGWLEQNTMDVLRSRWIERMRKADQFGRFRIYYPHLPGYKRQILTVHSKVMIVDDQFMRVGSSNLCNRSMGLDSECDLVLEADGDETTREAIVKFRNRLLGEHTDTDVEEFGNLAEQKRSLRETIEALRKNKRSLRTLDGVVPDWQNRQVPGTSIIDPEKPVDSNWFRDQLVPRENSKNAAWVSLRFIITILLLLGMAAAWRWTPLNQVADLENMLAFLKGLQKQPWLPFAMFGVFVVAGSVGMPVTVLVTAVAIVFRSWSAFFLSYTAIMVSASLSFGLGRILGKEFIEKYAGKSVRNVSRKVARQGILFLALVRLIPIAPFTVINTVGGASHVRFRDYFLGTLIGSIPGTFAVTFFVDQLTAAAQNSKPKHFIVATVIGLAFIAVTWLFKRWVSKKSANID